MDLSRLAAFIAATFIVVLYGCRSPEARPLASESLRASLEQRDDPLRVKEAFELYRTPPLGLDLPLDGSAPIESDAFWQLQALAFQPELRQLRRRWRASVASAEGAGGLKSVGGAATVPQLDRAGEVGDLSLRADLLALIGIGPEAAARDLAEGEAQLRRAELEETLWATLFALDRERLTLEAARRRESVLGRLVDTARSDQRRIELLVEAGRLPPALGGRARGLLATLDEELSRFKLARISARSVLARRVGMRAEDGRLLAPSPFVARPAATFVDDEVLFQTLPALRRARAAHCRAELALRRAAAEAWPRLELGPRLGFTPDALLGGAVLGLRLTSPHKVDAAVNAALEHRAASREASEDALLEAIRRRSSAHDEYGVARSFLRERSDDLTEGSAKAWRGARARLQIQDDADALDAWVEALRLRRRSLISAIDARLRLALAASRLREVNAESPGLELEARS